ncbi:MAG: site-specific DNA-methyltransferase [Candidatus Caldatribacteriota bacterium]|nr:site-specific DNA-methyltransferase [Candidatus Caldatribacteriota bacterium]
MEKLKMHSSDFTEENIKRLAELFPNCVTEDKDDKGNIKKSIDFDLLHQELSKNIVEGPKERYHLNWPGKCEALLTANAPIAKTLRPCREESVDFDDTQNLFIEGDNLDALKLMQETYLGKIKMIYIDPPYNTGNDFVYEDDFAENTEEFLKKSNQKDEAGNRLIANTESNGRFHSDWLSMMYPRLKLARNLLKEDGVIFISIDDGEVVNLRKICDEIFGEQNFVAILSWHKKTQPSFLSKEISNVKEYLLFYKKTSDLILTKGGVTDVNKHVEMINISNNVSVRTIRKGNAIIKNDRYSGDLKAGIYGNGVLKIELMEDIKILRGKPDKDLKLKGKFKWTQETMNKSFDEGDTYYIKNTLSLRPTVDRANKVANIKPLIDLLSKKLNPKIPTNTDATNELKTLFKGISPMNYPKPSKLISYLIDSICFNEKIPLILDFFAGSATTAQAVMQLNAEDSGNRKFIMVQLPEPCDEESEAFKAGYKNIAEIGKERIRRAGKKIKEENALTALNLDIGFRVLKVDSSNMQDIYYNPDDYSQDLLSKIADNIKPDRTDEDLLFQVLLDWGVDLSLQVSKKKIADNDVFFVSDNALVACFAKNGEITEDFCKELAKYKPLRVVFRDSGFKDDSMKINVEQIFKLMSPHTEIKTI